MYNSFSDMLGLIYKKILIHRKLNLTKRKIYLANCLRYLLLTH